MLHITRLCHH